MAMAVLLAGCGEAPNPPIAVVQNYLNALGGGGYANACAMIDRQALAALMRSKHARMSCATFLHRCLPNRTIKLKSDQTQLLYANINVSLVWRFTGLGRAIEACRPTAHRHKPQAHSRHKH
jgi:hypothetical protein